MGKLHELVAIESDLKGAYEKIIKETVVTFVKKGDRFFGKHRKLHLFDAAARDEGIEEHKEMTTTVSKKLKYQEGAIIRYFDVVLQKDATNQTARADLIVDGKTLAEELPATFLLGMETKLKFLRQTYEAIPTLPPGYQWIPDPNRGEDVYIDANPAQAYKSIKQFVPQVLYKHTVEHPAQVEKIEEVKNVGRYTTELWYGMLSSADKSKLIGRVDKLIQAVKQARQRANRADIVARKIGATLFKYINEG